MRSAKTKFPKHKTAPVVLYSDSDQEALDAFAIVRKWGYKNTTILEGGVAAWTKAGNELKSGQPGTKIVFVPKPVPGSIAAKEFTKLAKSLPVDTVIIDVRDNDEVAKGKLKAAIHIPTQDIDSRLGEIPKNKKIIVHCKTGVRASMAYQTLKDAGFDAYFLNNTIMIKPDGRFKIKS